MKIIWIILIIIFLVTILLLILKRKYKTLLIILSPIIILLTYLIIKWEKWLDNIISLWIKIPKTPIENIDTYFFTNKQKNEIINIWNLLLSNSIYNVEYVNNKIKYYDFNYNVIFIDKILSSNIKEVFEKNNIKSLTLMETNNWNIKILNLIFLNKKFLYNYTSIKHNYKEWDIILSSYRVEKVIDENWYISRLCENRNICPNLQ